MTPYPWRADAPSAKALRAARELAVLMVRAEHARRLGDRRREWEHRADARFALVDCRASGDWRTAYRWARRAERAAWFGEFRKPKVRVLERAA